MSYLEYFTGDFLPILLLSTSVYLPYYVYSRLRYGKRGFWFHLAKYILVGYLFSLIYVTIFAFGVRGYAEYRLINLTPFVWVRNGYSMGTRHMLEQLILNVCMFIPYGFILPAAVKRLRGRLWIVLVICLVTTLLIETVQYFIGRSADIDDVIMNFAGGAIGCGMYVIFERCFGKYVLKS